jgi:hypothetical protein
MLNVPLTPFFGRSHHYSDVDMPEQVLVGWCMLNGDLRSARLPTPGFVTC